MLKLRLDRMAGAKRLKAERIGRVAGEWVELTHEEYLAVVKCRGAGDRVADGLRWLGVAGWVKRRWPDCGCEGRQEVLNVVWEGLRGRCSRGARRLREWCGRVAGPR